jgi:hypothetical protein
MKLTTLTIALSLALAGAASGGTLPHQFQPPSQQQHQQSPRLPDIRSNGSSGGHPKANAYLARHDQPDFVDRSDSERRRQDLCPAAWKLRLNMPASDARDRRRRSIGGRA